MPIPYRPLGEVLLPMPNKRLLQQGWSPRCLPTPSPDPEHWAVVKTTAIQAGWFDDTQNKQLPQPLKPRPAIEIQAGDLLMTCAGPRSRCGVPTLVRKTRPRLMMSGKMYRFRPQDELLPEFLEKWLLSPEAQRRIDRMKTGISDSGLNLTQDRFLMLPVPVPTVTEQRRIVEILEEHLSHLDAAAADLTRAHVRLESLSEAALRLRIPSHTVRRPLSDVLELPLSNGRSVPSRDGGFPVLRLTALKEDGVDLGERKGGAWERDEAVRFLVKQGDFLIARGNGSLRLVGKGSLLRHEPDEVAFPDTAIRARARASAVLPEFLSLVWNSRSTRDQIERVARTSAGIYKVNQSQLGAIQLPVPELSEQLSIIDAMSRLQEHRHVALETIDLATRRSRSLRRAVLAAAFEGKLTGRHTDFEVVEKLAEA